MVAQTISCSCWTDWGGVMTMPYGCNSRRAISIRCVLAVHVQDIYREAFNLIRLMQATGTRKRFRIELPGAP
ncbi:hypothetical protein DEU52_11822 [Ensifer adhaerens]|nr:hypothetical protein DEU52_11822 [Ensifer adhaerens]